MPFSPSNGARNGSRLHGPSHQLLEEGRADAVGLPRDRGVGMPSSTAPQPPRRRQLRPTRHWTSPRTQAPRSGAARMPIEETIGEVDEGDEEDDEDEALDRID